MVRCAMCDNPATTHSFVKGYGKLEICWDHYQILCYVKLGDKRLVVCLKKLIYKFNQMIAKVPLDKTPGQTQYNRGMRNAFRLAVEPVEKELERLIKDE